MPKMTTELIGTIKLPRASVLRQNAKDFEQSLTARFDAFKKFAANLEGCFQSRFIMFKQNVWYDFKTGLLLPKFDKGGCEHWSVEEFIKRVDGKDFSTFKMNFEGFEGRCISEDECRAVFNAEVNYPYRRQDKRRLIFHFGGAVALENYIYTDRKSRSTIGSKR